MLVNHSKYGRRKVGFIKMIRADGFSGTVVTIWGGVYPKRMLAKFVAFVPSCDTLPVFVLIVERVTFSVVHVSAKPFFTGRMIAGSFK